MEDEQQPFGLSSLSFFQVGCDCRYLGAQATQLPKELSAYILPTTAFLSGEMAFAEIAMGWNEEGIAFHIAADRGEQLRCFFPEVVRGDSIELFIDTRDVKTSGYNTRFCHHFFFLPEAVEGIQAGERTHFRGEDAHPLCDAGLLQVSTVQKPASYAMKIFIPAQCLIGYDPSQFARCGFTYRINRCGGAPQHFSAASADYAIEQQPSLWSTMSFVR